MNKFRENKDTTKPVLVVVMGVSGCGKSTIAQHLSQRNAFEFLEADYFHSANAIDKMSCGIPLNDTDREPWIESMCVRLTEKYHRNIDCCLAYSGLISLHRKRFTQLGFETIFVHLTSSRDIIAKQLEKRSGHFLDDKLLDSQFASLEAADAGEPIYEIKIQGSIEETVKSAQQLVSKKLFED
ncbi:MAG: gluconokinase [Kangiellaceae bacterium]|nr:gluconokinase [Kangiellaceae bacterium]